jgi:hypothetical protein
MSASTGTTSSASIYTTPAFWERLWRTAGIQSVLCFIVAYIVYGHQPQVSASADALAAFYDGDRMRILIAAVFYSLAVLNLMWCRFPDGADSVSTVAIGEEALCCAWYVRPSNAAQSLNCTWALLSSRSLNC